MDERSFLLDRVEFDFDGLSKGVVSFLGPSADKNQTHITLIAGANGTSKSRLLASMVEKVCQLAEGDSGSALARRYQDGGAHGLQCLGFSSISSGELSQFSRRGMKESSDLLGPITLPSRVLVLSNLVMDKFHYPKDAGNQFYHYLGVRQATNLTTTGSLDKAVGDAVVNMLGDPARIGSFRSWLDLVLPGGREIALQFPKLSQGEIKKYLDADDKASVVRDRIRRRIGSARMGEAESDVENIALEISKLFQFLLEKTSEYGRQGRVGHDKKVMTLRFASLSDRDSSYFQKLVPSFSSAQKAGFSASPSICFEAQPWIQFNQLSSGEQNLLSLGAKLISYARPGCLIAIDEPEVSLNVAWQQQYTDLIYRSLEHASGSHVLIATHSPHLIASLPVGKASLVMIEKQRTELYFRTVDARFEGWGAESVLYQVLGIPSASSFLFNRELATVLLHIQDGGRDRQLLASFLEKVERIDYSGIEPLEEIVLEINSYLRDMN